MRARVIVTKKCNRKCKGCCNERLGLIDKVSFEDLFKYEEICITGGEPMLMSERVVEMIHRLRLQGYTGKIWLYTASSRKLKSYADIQNAYVNPDNLTMAGNRNRNISGQLHYVPL